VSSASGALMYNRRVRFEGLAAALCLILAGCGGASPKVDAADAGSDRSGGDDHPGDASTEVSGDAPLEAWNDTPVEVADDAKSDGWEDGGADSDVDPTRDGGGDAGEVAPPSVRWKSGTRLRAMLLRGGNNVSTIVGIWDTLYSQECKFEQLGDGTKACVSVKGQITVRYADPECTMPIVAYVRGLVVEKRVFQRETGCGVSAFAPQDQVVPARLYQKGATCTDLGPPLTGGVTAYDYYRVVALPNAFATATESRQNRGGGLEARFLESADGGIFPAGIWDAGRGLSCSAFPAPKAGVRGLPDRCVPLHNTGYSPLNDDTFHYFGDDACTKPVTSGQSYTCNFQSISPPVALQRDLGCGSPGFRDVRAAWDTTLFTGTVREQPGCVATTASGRTFYAIGAEVTTCTWCARPRPQRRSRRYCTRRPPAQGWRSTASRKCR
jgi:hypothetical protein